MISCTEFIPIYSELFSYLDENYGGHKAVEDFWTYLFEPTGKGIPLINFAKKDGLKGCWDYWMGTLTEEAADCLKVMNEKQGWIFSHMHYCPSKGRLLELQKVTNLTPYYDYCGHCDYYRASLEKVGLTWFRNHIDVDKASCSSILYDPKVFKGMMTVDEDTLRVDITSKDNEYFHRAFHRSLNLGIDYIGEKFGRDDVKALFTRYTKNVCNRTIDAIKKDGLKALEAYIIGTYEKEKALDAIKTELIDNTLKVTITYCPAVKYLHETGKEVSKWYKYTTQDVMQTIADECGLTFVMDCYDEETGAAEYRFEKQ